MRRPALTVLVCALLVASAGCAGVLGGDSATTQRPTTESPTETAAAERLAPGVTADGVTDALALADAHEQALDDHSFVKRASVEWANGSGAHRRTTLRYANDSHWRWNRTGEETSVYLDATNGTAVLYADGERVLSAVRTDGNVSYAVHRVSDSADAPPVPPAEVLPADVYARDLVYALFGGEDVTVERGDDAAARVTGTASRLTLGGESVSGVEFSAAVTAEGVVESLALTYERGGQPVERSVAFDPSTGDPVERPDWYSTARNRTA